MPSTVEIACANCGTLYRVGTQRPDVTVLFQCVACQEHNLFHLGRVVALSHQVMSAGDYAARRAHIEERLEDCALDALAEAHERLGDIVNINVDVDFADRVDPPSLDSADVDRLGDETPDFGGGEDDFAVDDTDPISDAEVDAFLESLDAPDFWERLNSH